MHGLRDRYGAGPLHLLAVLASFGVVGYAFVEISERPEPRSFALWFGGAIVAHDLIAFPLYSALSLIAGRAAGGGAEQDPGAINYVRIPAVLSGLAFVVWFPLILGLDRDRYEATAGMSTEGFLGRWLLLSAALFAGAGVVYALNRRRARARDRAKDRRDARVQR